MSPTARETDEYIPMDEWPDVTKMIEGFGEPSLEDSSALIGQEILVSFDNKSSLLLNFTEKNSVRVKAGNIVVDDGEHTYRAIEVRDDIFLVDILCANGTHTHNLSFVYGKADGQVTLADSFMFDKEGVIRTNTNFLHGAVSGLDIKPRERSVALVGNRIYYRYSPTEHYEHIYLSPSTFVWHCVRGGEQGIADSDETKTFFIDDDLLIFHWREKFLPVESFLVIDLLHKQSIGRMFCWDAPTMNYVHLPFDSQFEILNKTEYPSD